MGQRITQRIYECGDCGRFPQDGEHMWEMSGENICSLCVDKDRDECECENLGSECPACEGES